MKHQQTTLRTLQVPGSVPNEDRYPVSDKYQAPEIRVIGPTTDLIKSWNSGMYCDGYTGYFYNR